MKTSDWLRVFPIVSRQVCRRRFPGLSFEPQIKEEQLNLDTGRRPVDLMDRRGPAVFARDGEGRRMEHPGRLLTSESGLAVLGQSGHYPEIGDLSAQIRGWRFTMVLEATAMRRYVSRP